MTAKPVKYAYLKKKNRRIKIVFLVSEDGSHSIILETKRLIDFKSRKVQTWSGLIGMDTFDAITAIFDMLREDADFIKSTNRELGQIRKDKFQCYTNIK